MNCRLLLQADGLQHQCHKAFLPRPGSFVSSRPPESLSFTAIIAGAYPGGMPASHSFPWWRPQEHRLHGAGEWCCAQLSEGISSGSSLLYSQSPDCPRTDFQLNFQQGLACGRFAGRPRQSRPRGVTARRGGGNSPSQHTLVGVSSIASRISGHWNFFGRVSNL